MVTGTPLTQFVKSFMDSETNRRLEHPRGEEATVYICSSKFFKKVQSVLPRVENYRMDDKVEFYILLDLISAMHKFSGGDTQSLTERSEFAKELLSDATARRFLLRVLCEMAVLSTCRTGSDIVNYFAEHRWTSNQIVDLPDPEGRPALTETTTRTSRSPWILPLSSASRSVSPVSEESLPSGAMPKKSVWRAGCRSCA